MIRISQIKTSGGTYESPAGTENKKSGASRNVKKLSDL